MEMENAQQQLNQKGNFLPMLGIVMLILVLGVGGLFIFNFNNQSKSSTTQVTPVQTEIKKLSLFYDTSMLGKENTRYYKADIDGQNKMEISIDNKSSNIGPVANGRFLGQFDFHNLEIAPSNKPTGFKSVIKAGEKELISGTIFSNDATKIAYIITDLSSKERNWKLYIVNVDGSNKKEVNINPKNGSFSPLAFDSQANKIYVLASVKVDENKTRNNLGVIDLASGDFKELIEIQFDMKLGHPLISPDFKKIYLLRSDLNEKIPELDDKIVEIDLGDGKEKMLFDPSDNRIHLRELRLAPDGKSLAFQYESDMVQMITTDIYSFDLVTGKATVLVDKTTYPNIEYVGSWSPDGKYLWFSRRTISIEDDIKNPGKYNNIERNIFENYVINVESKKVNLFHKDTETEPIRIMGWLAE